MIDVLHMLLDALEQRSAIELGIAPVMNNFTPKPVADRLAELPPGEARRLKRKFRKLWRRDLINEIKRCGPGTRSERLTKKYAIGKKPSPRAFAQRLWRVQVIIAQHAGADREACLTAIEKFLASH